MKLTLLVPVSDLQTALAEALHDVEHVGPLP